MLKKILSFLFQLIPLKRNVVIFESAPELDGSPWMIFLELKRRGFEKKYRFVWAVDSSFVPRSDIEYLPFFGKLSLWQKIKRKYFVLKAKLILDSNRPIYKEHPSTIRIFVRHGGPFKKCTNYMHALGKMDYILTLSSATQDIDFEDCQGYCVDDKADILTLGFPANDRLFDSVDLFSNNFYPKLCSVTPQSQFDKIIGWLPTFRQHREVNRVDSEEVFPFGIPLVKTEENLDQLNGLLKEKNILLAIQMHHAQMANFSKKSYSNIILIKQELKYEMNVSTANLMQSFDALITDYSAAYHEYIMLDRPVALTIDDYDSYVSKTGFLFDYFEWIKGVYLKTISDLILFIEDVAAGVDSAKAERKIAAGRIHKYIDNKSTQRVVDFIVENVDL